MTTMGPFCGWCGSREGVTSHLARGWRCLRCRELNDPSDRPTPVLEALALAAVVLDEAELIRNRYEEEKRVPSSELLKMHAERARSLYLKLCEVAVPR